MAKRTYSDEEKAHALLALQANGGNVYRTAKETGIPRATLALWRSGAVHHEVTDICQGRRAPLADRLEDLAHRCLDVLPEKLERATAAQAAVALSVAVEKMRLLREQPTQNVRNDNLSDEQRAGRIAELLDAARGRRARQSPGEQPAVH